MNTERNGELSYQKNQVKFERLNSQREKTLGSIVWNVAKGGTAAGLGVLLFVASVRSDLRRSFYEAPQPARLETFKFVPMTDREKLEIATGVFLTFLSAESLVGIGKKWKEVEDLDKKFPTIEQMTPIKKEETPESTPEKTPDTV